MKKYLPFVIIIVVLLAATTGAWMLWKNRSGSTPTDSTFATALPSPPSNPVTTQPAKDSASPARPDAKAGAPVVIEEYGDYQCPPCGQLHPELKQIEHEFGKKVQIVFRHFPLTKIHKNALLAAHAAEAARNQNKFWEMHDVLYQNQKQWSELEDAKSVFLSYAQRLNLNLERFQSDLQSNLVGQRIIADIQRGTSLGVTGTPTVFLDSNRLNYEATNTEGLRRGINLLLERWSGS